MICDVALWQLSILNDLRSLIFARDLEAYDAIVISSGVSESFTESITKLSLNVDIVFKTF